MVRGYRIISGDARLEVAPNRWTHRDPLTTDTRWWRATPSTSSICKAGSIPHLYWLNGFKTVRNSRFNKPTTNREDWLILRTS